MYCITYTTQAVTPTGRLNCNILDFVRREEILYFLGCHPPSYKNCTKTALKVSSYECLSTTLYPQNPPLSTEGKKKKRKKKRDNGITVGQQPNICLKEANLYRINSYVFLCMSCSRQTQSCKLINFFMTYALLF